MIGDATGRQDCSPIDTHPLCYSSRLPPHPVVARGRRLADIALADILAHLLRRPPPGVAIWTRSPSCSRTLANLLGETLPKTVQAVPQSLRPAGRNSVVASPPGRPPPSPQGAIWWRSPTWLMTISGLRQSSVLRVPSPPRNSPAPPESGISASSSTSQG